MTKCMTFDEVVNLQKSWEKFKMHRKKFPYSNDKRDSFFTVLERENLIETLFLFIFNEIKTNNMDLIKTIMGK